MLQTEKMTRFVGVATLLNSWFNLGEPQLTVQKGTRELKTIPPAVKKQPAVLELIERQKEIQLQLKRMRRSLEEAMVRGDLFTVVKD